MTTSRERQQRYRARLRQAGKQRIELWLDAEDLARIEDALSGVTGNAPSPLEGEPPDPVTSDALLLTFMRLFFPVGKPVYPRRAYGLRTLPLGALNTWLAPQGYVLHAAKVRNRDWFVACTDHGGQTDVFGLFELRRLTETEA